MDSPPKRHHFQRGMCHLPRRLARMLRDKTRRAYCGNMTLVLTVCLALLMPQVASAQRKEPTDAQCRNAVNSMVRAMKSTPLEREKDKQSAKVLIERVEKLIKDNRAKEVSECETWSEISRIVANQ